VVICKKKEKKIDEGNVGADQQGDCWIYLGVKSETKLHLAHSTGKRVQETADIFMEKIKKCGQKPTDDNKATFYSDGNDQYTNALLKCFDTNTINYGQLIKERENGRVIGKTKRIIFGSLYPEDIDTVHIERYNLTMRLDVSRLVRKTLCFSKCKNMLDNHLDIFQCYSNLIKPHSALTIENIEGVKDIERTPCMAEEITDHLWTWKELLMFKSGHEN
jgi:IS1 family transposase